MNELRSGKIEISKIAILPTCSLISLLIWLVLLDGHILTYVKHCPYLFLHVILTENLYFKKSCIAIIPTPLMHFFKFNDLKVRVSKREADLSLFVHLQMATTDTLGPE